MPAIDEEPFFNLKAVLMQTGLKADTLRAWERRYGLPSPERSAGRHRLYSQRDISIIKWLVARQQEGLSIKQAVELWRQLASEGHDPLYSPPPLMAAPAPAVGPHVAGKTIVELRTGWLGACLAYDEPLAEQILLEAFALYPPEVVCLDLLQKAVAEIGGGWYRGQITVQQEHFCSALALRRVEALIMATPPPTRSGRILAACPPGEQHVFSLLLLTLLLRRRGWDVVYLGANVPQERLEATMAAIHPHLVIFAAQQLHSAATLLTTAQFLRQTGVPVAYGGLIFNLLPELRRRIPGHFLGEQLESAPEAAELLLSAPPPLPDAEAVPEAYRQAREHLRERHWLIEARLDRALAEMGIARHYFALANRELAANIDAALSLGDLDFLGADIDWLKGLLQAHRIPAQALRRYLDAYRQAASEELDERGEIVVAWLDRLVQENSFDWT